MFMKFKNVFINIIFVLVMFYLVVFIPSIIGYKPIFIESGSMEPVLKAGGLMYYHDTKKLDVGDILVYKVPNHIVSHRIVEKVNNGYKTKGDNNDNIDVNIVDKKQVLGKGSNFSIPYLGYYIDFIYRHKYLLYIAIFIFFIDFLIENYRVREYEKEA